MLKLLQNNQFDTIYHEHFSYFSLITLEKSFSRHGLVIFDVDELTTHGGSLRIYLKHIDNNQHPISPKVKKLQNIEIESGLTQLKTYENFAVHVNQVKKQLQQFCMNAKNKNKKIIGYGAPAKGNTLLNYCQINDDKIVPIELMIGSFVNAELSDYDNSELISDFRASFSLNLKKLMRLWGPDA